MQPLRATAEEWVKIQLEAEQIPGASELASALVAIAERENIAIELLIRWIHDRHEGKQWTAYAWQRWCTKYNETRRALEAMIAGARLCTNCGNPLLEDGTCSANCGQRVQ